MAWEDFEFDPEEGLENATNFPSKPTSGAAARTQFMTILNQIKAFFNGTVKNTIDEHEAENVTDAHGFEYEEGTWTPYYVPETGAFGNLPYASTRGHYKRVGNIVHVGFIIAIDTRSGSGFNLGTASGNLSIGGLPFASNDSFALSLGNAFRLKDVADTLLLSVSQDEINLRLYNPTEAVSVPRLKVSNMSTDNINASSQISGTGFYFID